MEQNRFSCGMAALIDSLQVALYGLLLLSSHQLIFVVLPMCLNASLVQGDAERALTAIADAFSPEFQQQGGGFNKSIEELLG